MTVYEKLFNSQLEMALILQRLDAKQKVIGRISSEDDMLYRTCEAVYEILHVLRQREETDIVAETAKGEVPNGKTSWIEEGKIKFIRCNPEIERRQKEDLGYGGRVYLNLKCPYCRKITMVDETIFYSYCPHCGVRIKEGG